MNRALLIGPYSKGPIKSALLIGALLEPFPNGATRTNLETILDEPLPTTSAHGVHVQGGPTAASDSLGPANGREDDEASTSGAACCSNSEEKTSSNKCSDDGPNTQKTN